MKRFILVLIPFALAAVSCATESRDAASAGKPSCCVSNVEPAAVFTDRSLYQLDSTWTNDAGRSLKLGELQGRVQVVAMFFSHCAYACPIIVHNMQRIEAALPDAVRRRVGFTLVSFDTERDTAPALHAYRLARELPPERWTLLRGSPDDTLELAALLGVKYKREASGQFAHSNLITLLNGQGEIIHQCAGLNEDIETTVKRIIDSTAATTSQPAPHHE